MPFPTPLPDVHWSEDRLAGARALPRRPSRRTSAYVRMRDGVRIAVDVHLPADLAPGARAPAILRPTRYFRAHAVRAPFSRLGVADAPDLYLETRRRFLAAGYAWVDMDVRGSGASSGRQAYPWWTEEVRDGGEVVDWIVAQPWSDGRVGALGISYDGTAAELVLCNGHPAVRAVAPLFSVFDVYADVAFPGGVHLAWFMEAWSRFNRTLDRNEGAAAMAMALWHTLRGARPGEAHGLRGRLLGPALDALPEAAFHTAVGTALRAVFAGVRPVDEDRGGALLAQAVAEHGANMDVHAGTLRIFARDDTGLLDEIPDETIDACSPHRYAADLQASGAAIYGVSGWRDGAYQHSAIKRFGAVTTPGRRLTIGPLCHGGRLYVSPAHATRPAAFDLDGELLSFFDLHLRGRDDGIGAEPPVHYYTTGEEAWKSASSWPPPGVRMRSLYLAPGRGLSWERPGSEGADEYVVDVLAGTGGRSRWRGLLNPFIRSDYPDRRAQGARLLVYTSPPLEADLEVSGHPVVALRVSASAADATLFAYLEEVAADGGVRYVTEGQLRALYRGAMEGAGGAGTAPRRSFRRAEAAPLVPGEAAELVFDLLPVSHRFRRGHAVRLAIAGADCDHFAPPPEPGARIRVHRGGAQGSRIDLPAVG
jgi:putative CocE/NonD family hydrolase